MPQKGVWTSQDLLAGQCVYAFHCPFRLALSILGAMQFFARGLFALPIITHFRGPGEGLLNQLRMYGWAAKALTLSALDWPLRRVTNGSSLFWSLHRCIV